MSRKIVLAGLAVLCLVATGTAAAEERSAPRDMVERLLNAPLPGRDAFDLAVRLRAVSRATPLRAPLPAAPLVPGFQDTFWILDQHTAQLFQAAATLRMVSEHAYWFVEDDMADRALQADLEQSANTFETRTYPVIERYFGALPDPGADNAGRIVFLLGNVPGVAAYFSSADTYPRAINPRSNEHEMIYVNLSSLRPGQPGFDSTVTHELQHMAHFNNCPNQEGWVDEGASELAMRIAGYESAPPTAFAAHPDTQLTTWSTGSADVVRHYQSAYLFIRYVAERAGGWDALPRLLASCARGQDLFSTFLTHEPTLSHTDPDVDSLFADWTVANLLQDGSVADGRYAYAGSGFHAAATGTLSRGTPFL
jgi:immune inhibitor A